MRGQTYCHHGRLPPNQASQVQAQGAPSSSLGLVQGPSRAPAPRPVTAQHNLPGLCVLTPVTLGQPALRSGHRNLHSFLERERKDESVKNFIRTECVLAQKDIQNVLFMQLGESRLRSCLCGTTPFSGNAQHATHSLIRYSRAPTARQAFSPPPSTELGTTVQVPGLLGKTGSNLLGITSRPAAQLAGPRLQPHLPTLSPSRPANCKTVLS